MLAVHMYRFRGTYLHVYIRAQAQAVIFFTAIKLFEIAWYIKILYYVLAVK